ncbi:MAG: hypothetical protein EBT69_02470 [Verrucomicrobia bacterium]|nr:hypothetical protein [Verrucomicrobiota bacterium]
MARLLQKRRWHGKTPSTHSQTTGRGLLCTRIGFNARHEDALRKASEALATTSASLISRSPPELVASDLRLALQYLESVLGVGTSEDVLDRLFAQFCIGK